MSSSVTDTGATARLRILLVDHDPLVRRVVRDALRCDGLTVVAETGDGAEAVDLARRHRPDTVLMDIAFPDIDGAAAIRRIVSSSPLVRVIVLTATRDPDAGIRALRAGASGYVTKDVDLTSLPRIVNAVARGEAAVSRSFVPLLIDQLRAAPEDQSGLRPVRSPLTPREWEVLDLLSSGLTAEEVTDKLVLSSETVRSHIQRAMRKLRVHSREEAVEAVRRLRAAPRGASPAPGSRAAA